MDGSSQEEPIGRGTSLESLRVLKNTLYWLALTRYPVHLVDLVYLVCLVYLVLWLNETKQMNQK